MGVSPPTWRGLASAQLRWRCKPRDYCVRMIAMADRTSIRTELIKLLPLSDMVAAPANFRLRG
jgi:hypothetical protein